MSEANYDEWSDLQVVTEVAKRKGLLVMPEDGSGYSHDYRKKYPSTVWVAKHEFGNQIEPWEQFNCIKCPNDAWPMMNASRIEIKRDTGQAHVSSYFNPTFVISCRNDEMEILRAAMICFLKCGTLTED